MANSCASLFLRTIPEDTEYFATDDMPLSVQVQALKTLRGFRPRRRRRG